MKTAIIKTDFWKEDQIFKLLPDVRLFYICLLTNPERNTTRAFKCSDRLLAAYTGYNTDTIAMCKQSLIKAGFIKIIDSYYVLSEQQCVEPKRGNLTKKVEDDFISSLPLKVQEELMSGTSASLDYNNINNNNNINKDNNTNTNSNEVSKDKYTADDRRIASLLFDFINKSRPDQEAKPLYPKKSDIEAIRLMRERDNISTEKMEQIILILPDIPFWGEKFIIRSGGNFRKNWQSIVSNGKSYYNKQQGNRTVQI